MTKPQYQLQRLQHIPRRRDDVFDFFTDAGNLQAITPPFLSFGIVSPMPVVMHAGIRVDYSLALFGIRFGWRTRITHWQPGVCFVDEQELGPYALWRHTHHFADDDRGTLMSDTVEYSLSLGPVGRLAHWLFVRRTLDRIFDYRQGAVVRRFAATPLASATAASGLSSHSMALEES